MYLDPNIQASAEKVAAARAENVKLDPRRMTAEEKDQLLKTYHPDYLLLLVLIVVNVWKYAQAGWFHANWQIMRSIMRKRHL